MKQFIFICPKSHQVFETDAFRIIEDHGVRTDASGKRVWDARIELTAPCPLCGEMHTYTPQELPCPFT